MRNRNVIKRKQGEGNLENWICIKKAGKSAEDTVEMLSLTRSSKELVIAFFFSRPR